ncbi:MAG: hypothetical protein RLZZ453_593 [Chlamydiota bacterium]|jgi:glycosyltransferase involved in cell wall biosynthesis
MIVKNEAHVITRCLESLLPLIDSWVIVDTGSSDGTQDVIREYMASKGIPGQLYERPWINFAHNRNQALELARPFADYVLFMDADDILTYSPGYVRPAVFDKDAYYLHIHYSGTHYDRMTLVRTTLACKWIGVVHEVIVCDDATTFAYLDGVTMKILGGGGRSIDANKFLKDAQMLEEDLLKDPDNSRSEFYLAQSYRDAGMYDKAIEHYQRRVSMGGWQEEVFWSLYQIAMLQEQLGFDPDTVIASYYKAFDYRPIRGEPLYRLASVHRKMNQPYQGFFVANLGAHIRQPKDLIFVEAWIYEFGFLFEQTLCAYFAGMYQEALNISIRLLANPELPPEVRHAVENNLQAVLQGISGGSLAAS